eukprot:600455-Prymnesium_polylepis.2
MRGPHVCWSLGLLGSTLLSFIPVLRGVASSGASQNPPFPFTAPGGRGVRELAQQAGQGQGRGEQAKEQGADKQVSSEADVRRARGRSGGARAQRKRGARSTCATAASSTSAAPAVRAAGCRSGTPRLALS